jgi:hypothetical protein
MEITLEVLERRLINLSDIYTISWYNLKNDAGLIKLVVNGADKNKIEEYLEDAYPDYFDEED